MNGKRRQHGADFKARVALAALKGDKTINEERLTQSNCKVRTIKTLKWAA